MAKVWHALHTVQSANAPPAHRNSSTITANQLQIEQILPRGQILASTGTTTDHDMSYLKQWTKKIPTVDQVDQSTNISTVHRSPTTPT